MMALFDDALWFAWIVLGLIILWDGGTHEIPNYFLAFLTCFGVAMMVSRTAKS
jgi:hypothetical protein